MPVKCRGILVGDPPVCNTTARGIGAVFVDVLSTWMVSLKKVYVLVLGS